MKQFAALGYIEDPGADKEKAAASADIEAKYNVSRTYLWKGRPDEAQPLLEELVRRRPWEDRFLMQLAACYFQNGYLAQSERVLRAISDGRRAGRAGHAFIIRENQNRARRSRRRIEGSARGRGDGPDFAQHLSPDRPGV